MLCYIENRTIVRCVIMRLNCIYKPGILSDQDTMPSHLLVPVYKMSLLVRKPTICIGDNKGADQLRGNREADQHLCFRYSDSTIPLLLKSEISSF